MHVKKLMKFIEVSRITNIIHQQYQKRTNTIFIANTYDYNYYNLNKLLSNSKSIRIKSKLRSCFK
ncbi:hypothetical protein FM106_06220 [Brachybacterium faecium]|nr:hypothetical protein FM106_06220 [Brachybacterium faecium]